MYVHKRRKLSQHNGRKNLPRSTHTHFMTQQIDRFLSDQQAWIIGSQNKNWLHSCLNGRCARGADGNSRSTVTRRKVFFFFRWVNIIDSLRAAVRARSVFNVRRRLKCLARRSQNTEIYFTLKNRERERDTRQMVRTIERARKRERERNLPSQPVVESRCKKTHLTPDLA